MKQGINVAINMEVEMRAKDTEYFYLSMCNDELISIHLAEHRIFSHDFIGLDELRGVNNANKLQTKV